MQRAPNLPLTPGEGRATELRLPDPRIRRFVMLAPPNNGSLAAEFFADNALFRAVTGRSGQQLFETAFNFNHFHVYQGVDGLAGVDVTNPEIFEYTNFTLMANFDLDPASSALFVKKVDHLRGSLAAAAALHTIGFGTQPQDRKMLTTLAQHSGGQFIAVD